MRQFALRLRKLSDLRWRVGAVVSLPILIILLLRIPLSLRRVALVVVCRAILLLVCTFVAIAVALPVTLPVVILV
jgi:hypothetical protein